MPLIYDFKPFEPVTREACMQSIPVSDYIIQVLIDKVIADDKAKELAAKKRSIGLAISAAWTTAFNN